MFYHDRQLQYKVRVEKPNPEFAKLLQQAMGGIDGKGAFSFMHTAPLGGMPDLAMPDPATHAQVEQMVGRAESYEGDKSLLEKAKDVITGK